MNIPALLHQNLWNVANAAFDNYLDFLEDDQDGEIKMLVAMIRREKLSWVNDGDGDNDDKI